MKSRMTNKMSFFNTQRKDKNENFSLEYYKKNAANRWVNIQNLGEKSNNSINAQKAFLPKDEINIKSGVIIQKNLENNYQQVKQDFSAQTPQDDQFSNFVEEMQYYNSDSQKIKQNNYTNVDEVDDEINEKEEEEKKITEVKVENLFQNLSLRRAQQINRIREVCSQNDVNRQSYYQNQEDFDYQKYQTNFKSKYSKFIKSRNIQSNSIIQLINKREQDKNSSPNKAQCVSILIEPLTPIKQTRRQKNSDLANQSGDFTESPQKSYQHQNQMYVTIKNQFPRSSVIQNKRKIFNTSELRESKREYSPFSPKYEKNSNNDNDHFFYKSVYQFNYQSDQNSEDIENTSFQKSDHFQQEKEVEDPKRKMLLLKKESNEFEIEGVKLLSPGGGSNNSISIYDPLYYLYQSQIEERDSRVFRLSHKQLQYNKNNFTNLSPQSNKTPIKALQNLQLIDNLTVFQKERSTSNNFRVTISNNLKKFRETKTREQKLIQRNSFDIFK